MKLGGLLDKHICEKISNETAETVNFDFSHYKSMGTISCNRNRISYQTGNNQRTNGSVNAHLISGPRKSTQHKILIKMAEQTLNLITHNPSLTHSVYYIYQVPGHRRQ